MEMVPEWDKVRGMFRAARRQEKPRRGKLGVSWERGGPSFLSRQKGSQKRDWARRALALQNCHENNF